MLETQSVSDLDDERAHRTWRHQCFTPLRVAEARQINSSQVGVPGKVSP